MAKTLLITGASSGIGEATAHAAAKAGWNVALLARSEDKLQAIASDIGDAALPIACDVTNREALSNAIAQTVEKFGGLNAFYANAGRGAQSPGIEDGDPDDWHDMIHINVLAVLYAAHAAIPELKKTKGDFVITGSKAGRDHFKGSIYGATKWFVQGFAGNLSDEMREWGGRCTVVTPGMVDTAFFDEPKPGKLQAEDIANAVIYAIEQPASASVREIHLMPND